MSSPPPSAGRRNSAAELEALEAKLTGLSERLYPQLAKTSQEQPTRDFLDMLADRYVIVEEEQIQRELEDPEVMERNCEAITTRIRKKLQACLPTDEEIITASVRADLEEIEELENRVARAYCRLLSKEDLEKAGLRTDFDTVKRSIYDISSST
eukprot:TRINITY_DN67768_c10_g2_i1.p1 TRINITY_DN67768_c10_g2~~TRINITY_DN67768_c10_g2_i1.p1  ORF type:complete len:165 (+),score=9.33 TRINITY_DN67768_c10_g2_i1:36-497(+)